MAGPARQALRGWWGRHGLRLAVLSRTDRTVAIGGIALAAVAATTMIITSRDQAIIANQPCLVGDHYPWSITLALGIAVLSMIIGLTMIATAGVGLSGWRLPRLRFVAVLLAPLLLAVGQLVSLPTIGAGASVINTHLRAVWPFVTLVGLLVIMVASRGRGPRNPILAGSIVLFGFVGFAGYVVGTVLVYGGCVATTVAGDNLALVGFFAIVAIPVLLVWLGVEGLRLSSDVGEWALSRIPERRLLWLLLGVKVAVLLGAGLWISAGSAPGWLMALAPTGLALALAVPLVILIMLLLGREDRLVGPGGNEFVLVSRGFAVVVALMFLAVPAYGLLTLLSALPGRPAVALTLLIIVVIGVVGGLLLRRGGRAPAAGVLVVGMIAGYLMLIWAYRHSGQSRIAATFAEGVSLGELSLLLGLPLAAALIATGLLLRRRRFRGQRVFFVALLLWVTVTTALPLLARGRLGTNAVAVDLVGTAAIALLAVALARGWQRQVSAYELVLLLITTTVIIEGPLLLAALPGWATLPLLIFAFASPAVAALTVEARGLTGPGHRARLLTRIGVICLGYGLLGVLAALVLDPLDFMESVAGAVNGAAALPFAVVLVAVTSARRNRVPATS